jgi:hypothetical protein
MLAPVQTNLMETAEHTIECPVCAMGDRLSSYTVPGIGGHIYRCPSCRTALTPIPTAGMMKRWMIGSWVCTFFFAFYVLVKRYFYPSVGTSNDYAGTIINFFPVLLVLTAIFWMNSPDSKVRAFKSSSFAQFSLASLIQLGLWMGWILGFLLLRNPWYLVGALVMGSVFNTFMYWRKR